MKLVKLTRDNGEPLWVNPDHVVSVHAFEEKTAVWLSGQTAGGVIPALVQGTPNDVATLLADAVVLSSLP